MLFLLVFSLFSNFKYAGADDLDLLQTTSMLSDLTKINKIMCTPNYSEGLGGTELYAATGPKDAKYDRVVKIHLESAEDIPPELKSYIPGEIFEHSKDGSVDVIISLPNDNAGMGLWQVATGNKSGDDFGSTHGLKVQVGKDVDGIYMQGTFITNLYTQQASSFWKDTDGRNTAYQFFTEENILKFVADNKNKGNVTFWQAGVGVMELNSEETRGWMFATGQQQGFHKAMGAWKPINWPDGNGIRKGAFVEGSVGRVFSDHIAMGGNVRIKSTGEVSGVLSSLKDASSVSAKANVDAYYQPAENKLAYTANFGVETTFHQTADSPSTDVNLGVGVGGKKMTAQLNVRQTIAGARQNYVNYNLDKGRTYTLEFSRKFGGPKGKGQDLFTKDSLKRGSDGSYQSVTVGQFELK